MREGTVALYTSECSKRLSSKAAASEEARRTLRYVEPLSDARTPLEGFFSILLGVRSGLGKKREPRDAVGIWRMLCRPF
jgi:hypothetical protein